MKFFRKANVIHHKAKPDPMLLPIPPHRNAGLAHGCIPRLFEEPIAFIADEAEVA